MDIDFNGNRRQPGPTDNSKCILANRTTGNYKDLIRGVTNRDQTNKERFNTVATGDRLKVQPSLPTGQGEEIDGKSGTLAIRQLYRNKQLDPSGILQARSINQLPFDRHRNATYARNETNLQELQVDQLLNILKKDYSFHETNTNVLRDREINKFYKVYGITDAHSILSYDDLEIWLENNNGAIYIWSRMENSIIFGGYDIREALMNFLFHQENLRYVNEYTHKLVPLDVDDREAKEWAESCEYAETYVITEESLKPLKRELEGSCKKE
ncbi:hypothetical protein C1646_712505 [Rhizophagus diaphanus]|nr:hypothetical protein C1646_712505 [Rhizophagus diaphanus] [Rhizophagus sp. MUCL 43196]